MVDPVSIRPQVRYSMRAKPLGEGTFAKVFHATDRASKAQVALKRCKRGRDAAARIKHEIKAQQLLAPHPHIMPIIEHDPGYKWYAMPIARGTLSSLRATIDEDSFASIIVNLANALDIAHQQGLVHRDISPQNILALEASDSDKLRWVVADWGMVRRPYNSQSPRATRTGATMGTPGFDAPELDDDPRKATPAVDVYSLGRVAAWFLTGKRPRPGQLLLPDGHHLKWRFFVKTCTEPDLKNRLKTMEELRRALEEVFTFHDRSPLEQAGNLLGSIIRGSKTDWEQLISLTLTYHDNAELYLDHLARTPTQLVRSWTQDFPASAVQIATNMAGHLTMSPWGDRDEQYAVTPLSFIYTILKTLTEATLLGLAQDVAISYFEADSYWKNSQQRARTTDWLSDLRSPADAAIAHVLARRPDLISYYQTGIRPTGASMASVFDRRWPS